MSIGWAPDTVISANWGDDSGHPGTCEVFWSAKRSFLWLLSSAQRSKLHAEIKTPRWTATESTVWMGES